MYRSAFYGQRSYRVFRLSSCGKCQSPYTIIYATRQRQAPKYLVGSGKAEEIRQTLVNENVHLLIANQNFSPTQERNLESLCKARVLGYSGLILDIFARRAQSYEGKLQVELAQLTYLSTRLVRGWSHLERQKGGIGLRGPGEKQLETDRRLCRNRIKQINKQLSKIKNQRKLRNRCRKKSHIPVISLVGYTNAGKSTVFNLLTHANTYVADMPFATLDTLVRRATFDGLNYMIFSDTVGFVRDLPPTLIEAFNATLQEVQEADLLLHIVDMSVTEHAEQQKQVVQVLQALGAAHIPQLLVLNKCDMTEHKSAMIRDASGVPKTVILSAHTGEGIELLRQAISERIFMQTQPHSLSDNEIR